MPEKPSVDPKVNSSYIVRNVTELKNSRGENLETKPVFELCACGGSERKPSCDGTHRKIGFTSDKADDRTPDQVDVYEGKHITIYDNRAVCTGAGYCRENSPDVFGDEKSPWIDPDAEDAEKTAATIRLCPSGSLSYRKDEEHWEGNDEEPSITITKNGPYDIKGGIELNDPNGCKPELSQNYSLCRCGASKNKPFCDGSHSRIDFTDEKN